MEQQAKLDRMEQLKDVARQKALIWNSDNPKYKEFMGDDFTKLDRVTLAPQSGTTANLIYQVKLSV